MEETTEVKKSWVKRLTNKYRLVILNDESFEEVSSVRLSRFNVYILLSTVFVIIVLAVASAIFFTPLKEYVPGYTSVDIRQDLVDMKLKTDSLEATYRANALYLQNLQNIINGGVGINKIDTPVIEVDQKNVLYDTINLKTLSKNEKKLRDEMESESSYSLGLDLSLKPENPVGNSLKSFYFFPPLNGYVTNEFDPRAQHYGIDVVAPENEPIKAVMDGVVIMSQWTSETGYVIGLQHANNLITLYKHNSVLLKKEGDYVRAGDVIAVIGNSGEQTTGPHLHFELWFRGNPINPKDYIVF
jgi:murein DD-endopeptidase MepM/ murein hydrolase activator NlpD